MEAVTDAYLNPPQEFSDEHGHMQLKQLAEDFSMTPLKVRKLLITTGAYQTAISKSVNALFHQGKSIEEIQKLTNLSRASVQSYLPYSKTVYKMDERTLLAERLQKYRIRKSAVEKITEALQTETADVLEKLLWEIREGIKYNEYAIRKEWRWVPMLTETESEQCALDTALIGKRVKEARKASNARISGESVRLHTHSHQ